MYVICVVLLCLLDGCIEHKDNQNWVQTTVI